MTKRDDPHGLDESDFLDKVHSFEHWFQSVEGYLSDHPYGHQRSLEEEALTDSDRDNLITALCNYCVGETAALEGASGLIAIAPNRNAKIFLATQVVDEARHLEVFLHRLRELGVADPESEIEKRAARHLLAFKKRLLELVAGKDWEAAIFAQNVILEAMEFVVFGAHATRADAVTAQVLEGVIKDERRHMGFGENDLGRRLALTPHIRDRLAAVKTELDPMVLQTFEELLARLDVDESERPELARSYLATVSRLGFAS